MPAAADGPPFQEGDFVWCAFPEQENPARPGPLHLAYVLAVSAVGATRDPPAFTVLAAYTTSQPWSGATLPLGVFAFATADAAALGQSRAFVMDLRRLAAVPLTREWFPRLDQPGKGVQGHMPKRQQPRYVQVATDVLTRHAALVTRLGPLWPGPRSP